MVAWLLKCNISRLFFMNFNKNFKTKWNAYFSCSKQTFYIIRMPISYSRQRTCLFSSIHHYIFFFMATKVNRSTKSVFLQISKNHNKKTDNPPKKLISPLSPT